MNYLTYANISLDILAKNYSGIKKIAGNSEIICVVKANAYGHGVIPCVQRLSECGCDFFAVAALAEALEIRSAVPNAEILILGSTHPADAELLVNNNITQTVYSLEYAEALSSALSGYGDYLKSHMKLDTGMNRLGFGCDSAGIADAIKSFGLPHLNFTGIYTHFSCADDEKNHYTEKQICRYDSAISEIESERGVFSMHHVCNSAATIRFSSQHRDAIRAGIILYGLRPSESVNAQGIVKPVMELYSTVTHVHTIPKGDPAGYGAAFTAKKNTLAAAVAIGYADGFLRCYTKEGFAELPLRGDHTIVPIIGRICMDQCIIDISEHPEVKPGDAVRLFGRGMISADDIAKRAGTIGYEVVCGIGKRVPRIFV